MGTTPDVLVIGGGIIGLTSALYLAKAGVTVEVVDKGELGRESSWAGAGIIPPGNPARAGTPFDRLRAYSTSRFPALSAMLSEETGIDNGFRVCGGIEFLDTEEMDVLDMWAAEGIDAEWVGTSGLRGLEPNLQPPALAAYHLPGGGQVRNPWHVRALILACEQAGVRLRAHQTPGAVRSSGSTLVATGAWADELLTPLGAKTGVRPVRGQMVLFRTRRPTLSRVVTAGKRYLVPRCDGRILAGATEEPGAGFEKATTAEGVAELVRFARELVPALADAEVEKTWAGLRPGSPDGMPFLGPVPGLRNVFAAVGHFRAGIQLSPGTAEVMTALITGAEPPVPVEAFRLDRTPVPGGRFAFRS